MLCLENTKSLGLVKQCRRLTCYEKFKDSGENLELSLDDIFSIANTVTDKTDYSELLKPFMSLFDNLLK